MILAICLLSIAGFSQNATTGIDFYADEVSNEENLLSIFWRYQDTMAFKLQNTVEINGHYYNCGGISDCEFQLVFVVDAVFIRDCEGMKYRSVKRCGRKNCDVIHLECISEEEEIKPESVDMQNIIVTKSGQ